MQNEGLIYVNSPVYAVLFYITPPYPVRDGKGILFLLSHYIKDRLKYSTINLQPTKYKKSRNSFSELSREE